MYFRSNFLEISKPIHFSIRKLMRNQKINVGICANAAKAAISYFQNGRHKMQNVDIWASSKLGNLNKYPIPMFSGPRNPMVA